MKTEGGRRLIEKAEPHALKRKRQEERSADKHREHENKKRKSLEAKLTREQHRKCLRALCVSVVSQHKQRREPRQSCKASKTARKAAPAQLRKPFPPPPAGVPQTTITSASTASRAARQPQTKSNLRRAFARLCGRGCAARASAWGVGLLLWRVGMRATRVKARPLLWLYSLLRLDF